MVRAAAARGFAPEHVLFDSWYSGLANVKALRSVEWRWLTRFRSSCRVNPDRTGLRAVGHCDAAEAGTVVLLDGYGFERVFRLVAKDGAT